MDKQDEEVPIILQRSLELSEHTPEYSFLLRYYYNMPFSFFQIKIPR